MRVAAVSFARMGSRRLPGKCLAPLLGRPLILHTVDFAERVGWPLYVWTRDAEIMEAVKDRCPIIYEPADLLDTEYNSTVEKMARANRIVDADYLILLQPTHPFRCLQVYAGWLAQFIQAQGHVGFSVMGAGEESSGSFYVYSRSYLQHRFDAEAVTFLEPRPVDIHTEADLAEAERCGRA